MKKHLAIFIGDAIEKIFSGEKSIESRFSLHRVVPYGEVAKDDIIMLKKSGGDIVGQVIVDNVLFYDDLLPSSIEVLEKEYSKQIAVGESFWAGKKKSKFGTLIFLKKAKRFAFPVKFKKKDRRSWVVLDKKMP